MYHNDVYVDLFSIGKEEEGKIDDCLSLLHRAVSGSSSSPPSS